MSPRRTLPTILLHLWNKRLIRIHAGKPFVASTPNFTNCWRRRRSFPTELLITRSFPILIWVFCWIKKRCDPAAETAARERAPRQMPSLVRLILTDVLWPLSLYLQSFGICLMEYYNPKSLIVFWRTFEPELFLMESLTFFYLKSSFSLPVIFLISLLLLFFFQNGMLPGDLYCFYNMRTISRRWLHCLPHPWVLQYPVQRLPRFPCQDLVLLVL